LYLFGMELFTMPEQIVGADAQVAIADAPAPRALPNEVAAVCRAWNGYKRVVATYEAEIEALRDAERNERGLEADTDEWQFVLYRYELEMHPGKIRERARETIIRIAEKHFAPRGASLDIPRPSSEECPAIGDESFDPEALWWHLAEKFSGNAGEERAYRDAAQAFARELDLKRGMEPKVVGGRVVLENRVYGDGHGWISHRSEQDLSKVLTGIAAIGEWAGVWNSREIHHTRWVYRAFSDGARYGGAKPERLEIGDLVLIVPYKSKVEWRFNAAFAEKVQLFLEEFGGFDRQEY
jgi:hypothetical protein